MGETSQGAGLGLAISKRILELHSGEIRAESLINVGTTLTFSLPASGSSADGQATPDADLSTSHPK